RRPRHSRIHLDHDHPPVAGIDCELNVATAGVNSYCTNDADCNIAHPLKLAVRESHRGGHRDRVAGVHTHRIEVFDRADDHHVVGLVAHDLELVFLPAQDRLLDQHLAGRADGQTGTSYPSKISFVVGEPGAHSAHGETGPDYYRITKIIRSPQHLFDRVADTATGD